MDIFGAFINEIKMYLTVKYSKVLYVINVRIITQA